jgi:hypothetical protein
MTVSSSDVHLELDSMVAAMVNISPSILRGSLVMSMAKKSRAICSYNIFSESEDLDVEYLPLPPILQLRTLAGQSMLRPDLHREPPAQSVSPLV